MRPDAALAQASGRAGITLSDAQATMTQGRHTPWALDTTGTYRAMLPPMKRT